MSDWVSQKTRRSTTIAAGSSIAFGFSRSNDVTGDSRSHPLQLKSIRTIMIGRCVRRGNLCSDLFGLFPLPKSIILTTLAKVKLIFDRR